MVVQTPVTTDIGANTAKFTLFYTQWCPYSQQAMTVWQSFQSILTSSKVSYGGYVVQLDAVDCDATKSKCQSYGVEAYPTYKLELPTKMIEYSGPANTETYDTFLQDALGTKVVEE